MAKENPVPKTGPGPKLPKPILPHVYVTKGLGFGSEEKLPPDR
jgi:hypothetical protein